MDSTPTLADLIRDAMNARLDRVWTMELGRVVSYDSSRRTATVQILADNIYVGESGEFVHERVAPCPDVPVFRPSGGPFRLSMPVQPGDEGLLIFSGTPIGNWQLQGGPFTSGHIGRTHHLEGAVFVPGVQPIQTAAPELTDDAAAVLGSATGPKVRVSETAVELGVPAASEPVLTVTDASAIFAALADPAVCAAIAATAVSGDPSGVVAALAPHVTAAAGSSVVKASR